MSNPSHAGIQEPRLKAAFATCRGAFTSAGVFSFFINLLMLTGPLFMLQVYDRVLTSGSIPTLVALLFLVGVLFAFMGGLELIRSRLLVRIARRVDEELSDETLRAVFVHALRHSPNVNSQPVRDLDNVRQFVGGPGPFTLFDAPWTPVYLGVIFLLHWWLGMFAVVGALVLFAVAAFNEIVTREPMARSAQASMASHALVEEGRRNSEVLKAMGMTRQFRAKWQTAAQRRPRPADSGERPGRRDHQFLQGDPPVPAVGDAGARRLSGGSATDHTGYDDRRVDHHVAGAAAGRTGDHPLALLSPGAQGL